jgi:hypothetical protein
MRAWRLAGTTDRAQRRHHAQLGDSGAVFYIFLGDDEACDNSMTTATMMAATYKDLIYMSCAHYSTLF